MADADSVDVKDVERVEVTPAPEGSELVERPEGTGAESSPAENEGTEEGGEGEIEDPADKSPDGKPEALLHRNKPAPAQPIAAGAPNDDDLKEVPGETPRERALRLEVTRLRTLGRKDRVNELVGGGNAPAAPARRELSEGARKVLEKYKPEEINALREVMPAIAEELGFVRADQLAGSTFAEKSQDALDSFLEHHPEYLPENDPEGTLWGAFKNEFGLYKQPTNPKDFPKLFEKVHRSVFGIKPGGTLTKVNAAQKKVQVASHAGASPAAPQGSRQQPTRSTAASGLRLDMLKGFSDDELEELSNSAG